MTDEAKLHGMMADPGPAPDHDANGWPAAGEVRFQAAVDGNGEVVTTAPAPVTVDGVVHKPGVFVADVSGYRWLVCRTCTDDALMPAWPCDVVAAAAAAEDSVGPASSSASTSGTGGLDDLLARLEASTLTLTSHTRTLREELEGQRRAVWDALILASRTASESYCNGIAYTYYLLTGLNGEEIERRLAAELDSRYGTDRTKGGEPHG
jgi:hypothetical protein